VEDPRDEREDEETVVSGEHGSDRALQDFLSEAQEIIETFNRDLLALDELRRAGRYDPEKLNDAFRAIHSLKGLAGLLGFGHLTDLAHTLETLLDSLRLGRVAVTPEILDLLFEAVELFGRTISDISAGHEGDAAAITGFLDRLEVAAAPRPTPAPAPASSYRLDA
jgi:two-component system chemotaxis sensor kinase CheA